MRQDLCALLRGNSYPGRGILLGRSGDNAVIAYFIMGRSENSRNRIFEETADGIRTRAFDESKMTDPSLIIYHPVAAGERDHHRHQRGPDRHHPGRHGRRPLLPPRPPQPHL